MLVWVDSKRIDRLAREVGLQPHNAWVSKNEPGTALFLAMPASGGTLVQVVSKAGTRTNWVAGGRPIVDDQGEIICYMLGKQLIFSNGHRFSMPFGSWFDFCPSKEYFFFHEGTNRAAVYRTADPRNPFFVLPSDFVPARIFFRSNTFYVFGLKPGAVRDPPKQCGLALSVQGVLKKQIDLDRFDGVIDMDVKTGLFLVQGKGEVLRRWGTYNLDTGAFSSLGFANGYGFFLQHDFGVHLEGKWKQKRGKNEK